MLKKTVMGILLAGLVLGAGQLAAGQDKPEAAADQKQKQARKLRRAGKAKALQQRAQQDQNVARNAEKNRNRPSQQLRQRSRKWFNQLKKAYQQKDMQEIGRLIEKRQKAVAKFRKFNQLSEKDRPRFQQSQRTMGEWLPNRQGRMNQRFQPFRGRRQAQKQQFEEGMCGWRRQHGWNRGRMSFGRAGMQHHRRNFGRRPNGRFRTHPPMRFGW